MDREAWLAIVHRVTKSRAWLKRLSMQDGDKCYEEKAYEAEGKDGGEGGKDAIE